MENRNFVCKIDDDFQVPGTNIRVLSLNRDYESYTPGMNVVEIEGVLYCYVGNSVHRWICIRSTKSFSGKTVSFKRKPENFDGEYVPY